MLMAFIRCLYDPTSSIPLMFNAWQCNMILEIISASRNARCINATPTSASFSSLVRSTSLWTRKRASLPFNRVYIINCSALSLRLSFYFPALFPTVFIKWSNHDVSVDLSNLFFFFLTTQKKTLSPLQFALIFLILFHHCHS